MYKLAIGLEIHTELLTQTKMFSSSKNDANAEPNTCINSIDLGLPGTLPTVNKQAVVLSVKLAKALEMSIDPILQFDRKNYFYVDLPKGYQITQFYHPIGVNGILGNVNIERIHLEEDTAKQTKEGEQITLDYNRAGVPLIEIVTKPDITSKEQCLEFLTNLKRLLIHLGVSDGKMESGSLRVDLNISVSNSDTLGTRCEIKNLNSFSNILEAIDYEFNRQTQLLYEGKQIVSETRRFDDNKKATIYMRDKAQVNEYHYMAEPNIPAVNIQSLIDSTDISTDELPQNIKSLLSSNGINESIINQLLDNYYLYKIFKAVNDKVQDIYLTITWIVTELQKLVNDNHHSIEEVNENTINRIIEMILSIKSGIINSKQAKTLIQHIYTSKKDVNELIKELGFVQITDEVYLEELLNKYIKDNPEMVKQYTERPERVEKFLIGLLMKNTNGQANPIVAKKVLDKLLK